MKLYLLTLPIEHTCVSQYEKEFALQSPYKTRNFLHFSVSRKNLEPGSQGNPQNRGFGLRGKKRGVCVSK